MTEKGVKGIFAKGKDLHEFQDMILENAGWVDTIREVLITATKARQNLKTRVLLYWKRIVPKYHLDENKIYDMNPETGEITLTKIQEVKK